MMPDGPVMVKFAVPPLIITRPLPRFKLRFEIWTAIVPLPLSVTVKLPDSVWPKTVIVSLVPLTVMVRLVPVVEKLTLTPPLIDTPLMAAVRATWPLKLPAVMWKLDSVSEAEAPVTTITPPPMFTVSLLRFRLPVPLLEMLPTIVPESETGPKVSLNVVLMPALMVNWPLPKTTLTVAGPMPPVSVPLRPVGETTRLPLITTGPEPPLMVIFATATSSVPVVESRVKVRSPLSAGRLPTVS